VLNDLDSVATLRIAERIASWSSFTRFPSNLCSSSSTSNETRQKPSTGPYARRTSKSNRLPLKLTTPVKFSSSPEKVLRFRLERASETDLLAPGDRDSDAEMSNIRPAARDFMGQAQSFSVQRDLAVEKSRQSVP